MTAAYTFIADVDRATRWDLVAAARQIYLDNIGETRRHVGNITLPRASEFTGGYRRYNVVVDGIRIGWVGRHADGRWHSTVDKACPVVGSVTYHDDHPTRHDAVQAVLFHFYKTGAPL